MSRDLFIIVLAVLTAIAGFALVMMLIQRRRALKRQQRLALQEAARRREAEASAALTSLAAASAERRRTIDDYAIPVGFDNRPGADEEIDIGKICPACGARYASHHRFCQRCGDSELAALN